MRTNSNKNIYILAFTLVVVMLGFGIVIPIMPFYIDSMGAGGTELGLLVASYAVMRLIFGPIWGELSDRYGRKPILMIGIFGYAITMVWFGLATKLWMLFAARSLSGILSSATSPTTMAYISDSTNENERGRGMGILGAAVGLGTIIGPGIGGLLGGENPTRTSLALPFFIAAALSILSLILIGLLLPESLSEEERQQSGKKMFSFRIKDIWEVLDSPIGILMIMAFLLAYALTLFYGIFGLYALERLSYGPQQVGLVITIVSVVSAVVQGGLVGPVTKRWGEAAVIKGCLIASALGFILILFASKTVTILIATGYFSLTTALLSPSVTSLTSKHTSLQQGITMGLSNSFMSLGRIVGPLLGGVLLDINIFYPYLSGAGVMFIGFIVSLIWVSQNPRNKYLTGTSAHEELRTKEQDQPLIH